MATIQLTLNAERWLDEVILTGSTTTDTAGADAADLYVVPHAVGDVALMELDILMQNPATLVANPELLGVRADVLSAAGSKIVDLIGVSRWSRITVNQLAAYFSPDPLVLIRAGEAIRIITPELDTNAAPTGDFLLTAKCSRVRPQEPVDTGPIRLVR